MFGDMKVSTRLGLSFGLVLVLLVSVIALGISRMAQVDEGLRTVTEENNVEMNHATGMRGAAYQVSISIRNLILLTRLRSPETPCAASRPPFSSAHRQSAGSGYGY